MNRIDPTGMDYWSTNDPEQIRAFINTLGNGSTQFDFSSGWNHMTDAQFLDKLTYNDETGKFWMSYGSVENGEVTINARSFDADITPVSFSGEGYPGAFVYEYGSDNALARYGYYYLYDWVLFSDYISPIGSPSEYYGGTNTWAVNPMGRITGLKTNYTTGMPPLVGKGGKISTKGMPHGDGGRALTSAEKRIAELQKQLKTATKAEQKVINKKIERILRDAQQKAKGETHHRR